MADNKNSMPTSPHIQIYRWSISSFTSIMHRLTGIALYFSIILISWYIVYYTYQINISSTQEKCACWVMQLLNIAFIAAAIFVIFALFYHLTNGIRHLFWDIGKGFDKNQAKVNGFLVIAISAILSLLTILTVIYLKYY